MRTDVGAHVFPQLGLAKITLVNNRYHVRLNKQPSNEDNKTANGVNLSPI